MTPPRPSTSAASRSPSPLAVSCRRANPGDSRSWASKYGLPAADNSARQAGEAALADIDEAWREPDAWKARALDGMTADEIEAMEDSPAMRDDLESAKWIGPELEIVRSQTQGHTGRWLGA